MGYGTREPFDPDLVGVRREPDEDVDALARAVIGAAIEVHRHLGPGFPESVYELALSHELELRGIPFEPQAPVDVFYKERHVGQGRIDLLVDEKLIVELKACDGNWPRFTAQAISYLRAKRLQLALVINFDVTLLKEGIKRVIL